jgi:NAD+ diphosphatase
MDMHFCRRCGEKLSHVTGHVFTCVNKHVIFRNSSPAVVVLLINEKREPLLAVRAIEPGKGKLHVPAGFCDDSETFEHALERELREELGLTRKDYGTFSYLLSAVDQYEYKGEMIPVVSAVYWATIKPSVTIVPSDDVNDTFFTAYDLINFDNFQFSAVTKGLHRLRELQLI